MKQNFVENSVAADDPTASVVLRELLNDTLVYPEVQALITSLKARKTSLVLSGGGGKGAYQAGVILALYDCGIKNFESIAGTSVGGLNAALCHELCRLNDRNLILNIWCKITYESVMERTFWFLIKLVLYVLQALRFFAFTELMQLIDKAWAWSIGDVGDVGLVSDQEFYKRVVYSYCFIVATLFLYAWVTRLVLIDILGLNPISPITIDTIDIPILLRPVLIDILGFKLPIRINFVILYFCVGPIILIIVSVLADFIGLFIGGRIALFSNAPLRRTIETLDIEAICDGNPQVICTLAVPLIKSSNKIVPFYIPLLALRQHQQEAAEVLLATAAIPEVFPAQNISGLGFVDGGIADNTPIFGALLCRPDILLIVYLDHRYARIKDLTQWEIFNHLMPIKQCGGGFGTEEDVNKDMYLFEKIKKIPIIPSKSLGGLFSGTLNFKTAKARELIALGYKDTLCQLTKAALEGSMYDKGHYHI